MTVVVLDAIINDIRLEVSGLESSVYDSHLSRRLRSPHLGIDC